jgi:hypothetical protein
MQTDGAGPKGTSIRGFVGVGAGDGVGTGLGCDPEPLEVLLPE